MTDETRTYRTATGRVLTDAEIEALADEAERGYNVEDLTRRPGRPRIGSAPAAVVPVRLHTDLHTAVKAQAEAERTSLSEYVRDSLRIYLATEPKSVADLRTTSGRQLTDAEIANLAAEAAAGHDVSALRGQPSRRSRGRAEVVPVRMPPELKAAVEHRAEAESTSVSEVLREALRARLDDDTDPPGGVSRRGREVRGAVPASSRARATRRGPTETEAAHGPSRPADSRRPSAGGPRASAGGARAAGGVANQARVTAWLASLIVAHQPAPWFVGQVDLVAVGGETGLAVDDVGAVTDRDGLVVIQAKGRLVLSTQRTSAFADAVQQVVQQFLSGVPDGDRTRPVDEGMDRLVIAGDGRSSRPIKELGAVCARLRTMPLAMPLSSAATNEVQARGLEILLSQVRAAWVASTSTEPADEDVRALLRVLVVDVLDLDEGGTDRAVALAHLRSVLLDPVQDVLAWTGLTELGRALAEGRAWRRRSEIAAELSGLGAPVGPARRHAADVRTLRLFSEANLAALFVHSGLSTAAGHVRCERRAIQDLADVDGSFVLVGEPGCGKSAVIYELGSRLASAEDVVVLGVENLPDSSADARIELGLTAGLVETLQGWSGPGRATLILDGLDATRGEGTTWLARLCESLSGTRWRVIASIRRFDLRHSLGWRKVFAGDAILPGTNNQAHDLQGVRHYLLGDLSDHDLAELATASPAIARLLDGASTQLLELVKNPFNLSLAVELLEAGASVSSLAATRDQLQLLQRYWRLRVIDAPVGPSRVRVLSAITSAMLASRLLRADAAVVPDALIDVTDGLLHDGVLHESASPLLAHGEAVLVFSHHILFDFAVAAVVFTSGGASRLTACLQDDPDLSVIARPSVDVHLADLWHADPAHSVFATVVRDLVRGDHAVVGVAAARTAAENVHDRTDLEWIAEEFHSGSTVARVFMGWLCGVMDAAYPTLAGRLRDRLEVWAELLDAMGQAIEREFDAATGQALLRVLFVLNKLEALAPAAAGAIVRARSVVRLMEVCLQARADRAWLARRVSQLLPGAVTVDAAHARTVLKAIDSASLAAFGPEVLRHLVEGIGLIAASDPDAATEVLSTVWAWEEDSDETTYITQGVLSLTSTKRQDVDNIRWLSGQKFPAFIAQAGLLRAIKVVGSVLRADSERYPDMTPDHIGAFGAEGKLLPVAHGLKYGPGHGAASTIVDAFVTALAADPVSEAEVVAVVYEVVKHVSHPEFWRRLLLAACDVPVWRMPLAAALSSGALLRNFETRAAAGRLMGELSKTLGPVDHARLLEEPIRRAAALFPPDADESRERAVDQLLGCLDVARVQDPEFRLRLSNVLAVGDPPALPEPGRVEGFWEPSELRDALGRELDDGLSGSARSALEDLYTALAASEGDGAESPTAALGAALQIAVADEGIPDAEPVRELITRAAERLARESSVRPGNALGELVAQILLKAATDDGAAS